MYSRLITLAVATLCAIQLHAGAATFQPVDDGLRPVYERIAAIEAEVKTLEKARNALEPQTEERAAIEEKIKALKSEEGYLVAEVLEEMRRKGSSLVTYMVPVAE